MTRKLRGRHLRKAIVYFLTYCMIVNTWLPAVMALESANVISSSGATPTQWGDHTIINTDNGAILNWNNFNTSAGQSVQFNQYLGSELSSMSAVLNRVSSGAVPTEFYGALNANGRVFVVNPAGIVFGAGSQVNVAQLVASGLRMSDTDFTNAISNPTQKMIFTSTSSGSTRDRVENNGTITAANSVYLVGENVTNNGAIRCPGGLVVMAAGDNLRLGQPGSSVIVDISALSTDLRADSGNDVRNNGTVGEAGSPVGTLVLAAGDAFSQAITNVGDLAIVANEYVEVNGDIDVTGSLEVLGGQSMSADDMYINANITAGSMRLKNGNDTVGERTYSRLVVADGKNLTATDGDVVVEAVHDIILGGNVSATGDIFLNADEDGYGDPRGELGVSYFPYPYGGGEVIASGTITAGDDVVIKANGMRFEDDVTATGGDLTITGR